MKSIEAIIVFLMLGLSAFADGHIKEAKELIHECDSLFSLTDCVSLDSCKVYINKYEQNNDIFYYSQFCKYFLIFTVELKQTLYQLSENDDEVYYIYLKYYNLLKDEER